MKTCIQCGKSKHETQFPVDRTEGTMVYRRARCRPCASARIHALAKKRAEAKEAKPTSSAIDNAWRGVAK